MKSGIYRIYHKKTNKSYIGLSANIQDRWAGHMKDYFDGKDKQLYNEMRKLKLKHFRFQIVEYVPLKGNLLATREKYFIDKYKANSIGFNSSKGGEGARKQKWYRSLIIWQWKHRPFVPKTYKIKKERKIINKKSTKWNEYLKNTWTLF